jgi:selenocysteine lyase/cysteine desulfurase
MPEPIDPKFIEERFPTLSKMTYLNNAATGMPPATTLNAMKEYLDNRVNVEGATFDETMKRFKTVRELLAKLLGGRENQYGFVASTSAGVNSFAHSVEYPSGSNIVLCDLEFPSNYIPWQNVSRLYNVELRVVKSVDGAAPFEMYKDLVDENTRVVAISQVQFGSGYRSDLKALADLVHDVDGFLVSDIIQAAGWAETNLVKENVDFATGQAAKWLIGPIGSGYVYVSDEIIDKVTPRFMSWWGVKDFREFGYFEREPLPDAKMFQIGSPAMVAYVGFLESLKTLLEIPDETREKAAMGNADYMRKRLEEVGIDYYNFPEKNKSPIVSCKPNDVEELHKTLFKERIFCSVRNGRLRVSPHFYNTHEEIEKLLEYLR